MEDVAKKAKGVFLWVRLVVRDLLKGLRDGERIRDLEQRLDRIPSDLDEFFELMLGSIEPDYQEEASTLLQIMLHTGECSVRKKMNLLDLSYIEQGVPSFACVPDFTPRSIEKSGLESFRTVLDFAKRRVNSRCMGLLESSGCRKRSCRDGFCEHDGKPVEVEFLHRTAWDFLRTEKSQATLHQYSHGPYPAMEYCCNTMLSTVMDLNLPRSYEWNQLEDLTQHALDIASTARGHISVVNKVEQLLQQLSSVDNKPLRKGVEQ